MKFFKIFFYISIVFLVFGLYKANYIVTPKIESYWYASVSIIFLFAGFILNALSWKKVLTLNSYEVTTTDSLVSIGMSVFGKYIPGKIWLILGRAAYIAEKYSFSTPKLSSLSLNTQFIVMWIGLIFGAAGLFALNSLNAFGWVVLLMWLGLTVVIFSRFVHSIAEKLTKKFLKREIIIPRLNFSSTLKTLPWFAVYWLLYSVGFFYLVKSLTTGNVPFSIAFAFPFAGTLGILAIIAPGGLGVREGLIAAYLVYAGFPTKEAMSIAIVARLWYFIGEIFIFLTGFAIQTFRKLN